MLGVYPRRGGKGPEVAINVQAGAGFQLPYNPGTHSPIVAIEVSEHEAVGTITVAELLELVRDPIASEKASRVAEDPKLRASAEIRKDVQRVVKGAKAANAKKYSRYLIEGLRGQRPWVIPPVTLYTPEKLEKVDIANGAILLLIPKGGFLTAIDGETQRIAWNYATLEAGDDLLRHRIKLVIHHGRELIEARQYFHDLNTLEVKPNAAIAIAMDSTDVATAITRKLAERNPLLAGRVDMARRQIPKGSEELVTISGLRTGIVMTLLGPAGIQAGARPVSLPEDLDMEQIELETLAAWGRVLEALERQFLAREETIVAQPIGLAGIGAMLHHVMPSFLRTNWPEKKLDEVVALLSSVDWRRGPHWDGIAGKWVVREEYDAHGTVTGTVERLSLGGVKEYGHAMIDALDASTPAGTRIRRRP
jgi:DGQHR domain-containing protein